MHRVCLLSILQPTMGIQTTHVRAVLVAAESKCNITDTTVHTKKQRSDIMTLEKAILIAMIEASYKDKIIDETTYHNMLNKVRK